MVFLFGIIILIILKFRDIMFVDSPFVRSRELESNASPFALPGSCKDHPRVRRPRPWRRDHAPGGRRPHPRNKETTPQGGRRPRPRSKETTPRGGEGDHAPGVRRPHPRGRRPRPRGRRPRPRRKETTPGGGGGTETSPQGERDHAPGVLGDLV